MAIIVLAGGSFQGKSLIASRLSYSMQIPTVICTDVLRNIIRAQSPDKAYLHTNTFILSKDHFNRQVKEVSELLIKLLAEFESRGEDVIIEGVHLSDEFFRYAIKNNFACFVLNNMISQEKKIQLKSITRKTLEIASDKISQENLKAQKSRMIDIHKEILERTNALNIPAVEYRDLETGYDLLKERIINFK